MRRCRLCRSGNTTPEPLRVLIGVFRASLRYNRRIDGRFWQRRRTWRTFC